MTSQIRMNFTLVIKILFLAEIIQEKITLTDF